MDNEMVTRIVLDVLNKLNEAKGTNMKVGTFTKKDLLDTGDLRTLFNVSERSIQRWRKKGILKYIYNFGTYYYLWEDIVLMLQSRYRQK